MAQKAYLIGVSGFGQMHYRDLLDAVARGAVEFAGATVINPNEETEKCERLRKIGCRIFGDHREMLREAEAGGICFVPTGIHLHRPMTCDALAAGLHVMVEKPAAATLADVDAMREAERASGRSVSVGFQHIYAPETRRFKRALVGGAIGRVERVTTLARWPRADAYYARNAWAGRLHLDGVAVMDSPFNNALSHILNIACFFAGETERESAEIVAVEAELYRCRPIESPDTAAIRAVSRGGTEILFFATHCPEAHRDPVIEVRGSRGRLVWPYVGEAVLSPDDGPEERIPVLSHEALRRPLVDAVLQRASDPSAFTCDLGIARVHTACVEAAHASSAVREIGSGEIDRVSVDGSVRSVFRGIDAVLDRAFAEGKLPSELGVPWAVAGQRVRFENGFSAKSA